MVKYVKTFNIFAERNELRIDLTHTESGLKISRRYLNSGSNHPVYKLYITSQLYLKTVPH